ncbi:MAG: hypothetical protein CMM96_00925 [Rickettsiales bacterium]|nr:hypothetical protein [Rickettsiales bacterium]
MDCEAEINRLFVGSIYIFGFFSFCLLSLSKGYTLLEQNLTNRIAMLEYRLEEYKCRDISTQEETTDSEEESSSCEETTDSEEESSSGEEEHTNDDVVVSQYWEYSNTI